MLVEVTERGLFVEEKQRNMTLPDEAVIRLPCDAGDTLLWEKPLEQAIQLAEEGRYFLWEFVSEFGKRYFDDPFYFQTLTFAVRHFAQALLPRFAQNTLGCIVTRLPDNWFEEVPLSRELRTQLATNTDAFKRSAYTTLSEYLHALGAELPVEVPAIALFHSSGTLSRTDEAYLFNKDVFEHVEYALAQAKLPVSPILWDTTSGAITFISREETTGLLLPTERCDIESALDQALGAVRILPERKAIERWDALDCLLYFPEHLTRFGKRVLLGFEAAGGTTIAHGSLSESTDRD